MTGRSDRAALRVAQVAEAAQMVAGGVRLPAGDSQRLPAAVATAGVAEHDVVAAIGEQLNLRDRGVGGVEAADWRLRRRFASLEILV